MLPAPYQAQLEALIERFRSDMQALVTESVARVNAAVNSSVLKAFSDVDRARVQLGKVRIERTGGWVPGTRTHDPTLEPQTRAQAEFAARVAEGWRWCDGLGGGRRHMWNVATTALAMFPKPPRHRQTKLQVARCHWHATDSTVSPEAYGLDEKAMEALYEKYGRSTEFPRRCQARTLGEPCFFKPIICAEGKWVCAKHLGELWASDALAAMRAAL